MAPLQRVLGDSLCAAIVAGALGAVGVAGAAPVLLTKAESHVVQAIDAQGNRSAQMLERIVNINSGTFNPAGVQAVGSVLESEFKALGFQVRFVPMSPLGRASHLIAERSPKKPSGKKLLLIGHMDTVFEPASGFTKYTHVGDTATGPGVVDDKGGIAVMLSALQALHATGSLEHAAITVFLTADEESPGSPVSISRREFIQAGQRADATLCFEGAVRIDGQDYISTARRGFTGWTLNVTAHAGHSGAIFSESLGDGAIYEMSRVLTRFHDELHEPELTYSVGLALGGDDLRLDAAGTGSVTGKTNIIPPEARAIGDIRALTPEQLLRVKEKMRLIVAESLNGTQASIEFVDEYPPMAPTPGNEALLAIYDGVSQSLGFKDVQALDPMLRGAGDSAFVAPYVATVSGLGAMGEGSHSAREAVELQSLSMQAKRAALMIYRLTHVKS